MDLGLNGKKALVTGRTGGVGRVLGLARSGVDVITCYRQEGEAASSLERELKETGGQHQVARADITEPNRVADPLRECATRFGRLDVVNNAAVISHVPHGELALDATPADRREQIIERHSHIIALGRLGRTAEVAGAELWLASDLYRYVTGGVIPIDGGTS